MSEITKLYENARAYDFRYDCDVSFKDGDFGCITNCSKGEVKDYCTDKKYFKGAKVIKIKHLYPPFTAEKQLEIVKMILFSTWWMNLKRLQFAEKFDEGLAQMINELWQDLTEEEKQKVKGILE